MATEDPMQLLSANNARRGLGNSHSAGGMGLNTHSGHDSVAQELDMLARSHERLDNILSRRDTVYHRSGSAPPSVEGSLASIGGLLANQLANSGAGDVSQVVDTEQELRSDPAYLAYYYSHVNLNPRLPPPLVTRDNYRFAQRLAMNRLGDKRQLRAFDDSNSSSLFSTQPVLPTHAEEPELYEDVKSPMGDFLRQVRYADGMAGISHGNRPKSLVDLIQEDFPRTPSPVFTQLRPHNRVANEEGSNTGLDGQLAQLRDSSMSAAVVAEISASLLASQSATSNPILSRSTTPNPVIGSRSATLVPSLVHGMGSTSGAAVRLPTPEPDIPVLTAGSRMVKGSLSGNSSAVVAADLAASLQSLNLQGSGLADKPQHPSHREIGDDLNTFKLQNTSFHESHSQTQAASQMSQGLHPKPSGFESNGKPLAKYGPWHGQQSSVNSQAEMPNMYAAAAAAAMSYMAANPYYQSLHSYAPVYGLGGYPMNPSLVPALMTNYPPYDTAANSAAAAAAAAAMAAGMGVRSPSGTGLDMQHLYKYANQGGSSPSLPAAYLQDPLYFQYLQQYAADDTRNGVIPADALRRSLHRDSAEPQKNHANTFARSGSYAMPMGRENGSLSPGYYGSPPGLGFVMPYGSSPISSPVVLPGSPVIPGAFSVRQSEHSFQFPSGACRSTPGGAYMGWHGSKTGDMGEEVKGFSLLEELKNNKTRRFELADILGHVVEFSSDQHGSRFIQQKLETVTSEEKDSVFKEILPHALTLMTDVFGNYVIQKFFEHGSSAQRAELAAKLVGHVLNLSLQMYGCRVIQKALEVVDQEQQILLISELDGHVMRCVRDQNGNHVIQKCIECVPPEHINFILSAFYGQVFMLSTHPYGCRVIQRVLEHCNEEQKQNGIIEEILRCICTLAQDQYGNYVVQHILEHGKPEERSEILTKMAGQIVPMSQHKFASNVVEKCLEFSGPAERQILITEMLGKTDENEPLQAMMKDQYANYVVQKVLETCDDQQRELLLSRIRVHLHALKKYTYGKHIVARVEKLVAAGERRGAMVSSI